ncbi:Prophage CP4-57 regulatory protein (AlpA) [Caballeronia choica]|uniref:Prophage CP4-57 regulatory protein (AlpA) n=1 Tax=Caballeronia choica TaxID=326476 RepID=A0A158KNA0_9BURK|nr:AlpA family phage regulatory protein [Caballeronia choica]SAL82475.1 Prophage CP4-57 regulatory protein (AlpA) [Caballeronia choica]
MPRSISLFENVTSSDIVAWLDLIARLDSPFVLLREDDVGAVTCTSDTARHLMRKQGAFPDPIKIGKRAVAWRGSDIAQWMREREVSKLAHSTSEQTEQSAPAQPKTPPTTKARAAVLAANAGAVA